MFDAVPRFNGSSAAWFVTAPKTPLRSICADTEACRLKPLELLSRDIPPGPTTQSFATGDFLKVYERPRIGGELCDGPFSETAPLQSAGRFCAFFSGPQIPFPGNGARERQRLGSNAGYSAGSPSIRGCRDHSAGRS